MLVHNKQIKISVKIWGLNYNKLEAYMLRSKVSTVFYVKFSVLCNVTQWKLVCAKVQRITSQNTVNWNLNVGLCE